jgi:hypothetical protein
MKWEYLQVACDHGDVPSQSSLCAFGKDGWELIIIIPASNSSGRTMMYFKRQKTGE